MLNALEQHPLFANIDKDDIEKLLNCFSVYRKCYKKNEYIVHVGSKINFVGIILAGRVFMENIDYFGNNYIYTEIKQNNLFGEVFICPYIQNSTVNYKAITDCNILFMKTDNILHTCKNNCRFHQLLIENLLNLIAVKSRSLIDKIEILSSKSIRERVLTYLFQLSQTQQSNIVESPLNHKEMANFLCVNRSSMLRELHQMKEDHLIDFSRNHYTLNDTLVSRSLSLNTD